MADRIRFGIIGAAGRGNSFVQALRANPATELTALCDVRLEPLQANAAELGVEHAFTDAGELLDSGAVDAVILGTPMPWHVPHAILALERDIHVLSEVTAGVSIEECRDLVRAARRSTATYMMAENFTYMKPNVLVRELARAGAVRGPLLRRGRLRPPAPGPQRGDPLAPPLADRRQRLHLPDPQPRPRVPVVQRRGPGAPTASPPCAPPAPVTTTSTPGATATRWRTR